WLGARFTILLLVVATCLVIAQHRLLEKLTGPLLLCLLFNPVVFHYSHLAMTEIPATCFLLLALTFFHKSIQKQKLSSAVAANVFLVMAIFTKISFVYVMGILPVVCSILYFTLPQQRSFLKKMWLLSIATGFITALLFYFAWYLPHQTFLTKIFTIQSELKLDNNLHDLWQRITMTHRVVKQDSFIGYSVYLFYVNVVLAAVWLMLMVKRKLTLHNLPFVLFCLVWMAFELLKLVNVYLPSRYLISTIVVNTLLFVVLCKELQPINQLHRFTLAGSIMVLFGIGMSHYIRSFSERSFQIKTINDYFAQTLKKNNTSVVGNWASVCCWKSEVYSRYCVNNYGNQQVLLQHPKPQLILSEAGEEDSEGAFKSVGYDLKTHADSVITFKIANWQIYGYWISH
ncbi:MAG TPA: hypothetical protein VK202_09290, partial [Bacteroidia bacterium]|nr:hypothetical protein [Bacteroidia bacterium]